MLKAFFYISSSLIRKQARVLLIRTLIKDYSLTGDAPNSVFYAVAPLITLFFDVLIGYSIRAGYAGDPPTLLSAIFYLSSAILGNIVLNLMGLSTPRS